MADLCSLSPLFVILGSAILSTVVGLGIWKFGVSPAKLEAQRLGQLNRELTHDLVVKTRQNNFHLRSYIREREAHDLSKRDFSLLREKLRQLEYKKSSEESSSERSKLEETFEHANTTTEINPTAAEIKPFDGPNCPLENYIIDPDFVAVFFGFFDFIKVLFNFFSWGIGITFFLLSYQKGFLNLTVLWFYSQIKQTYYRLKKQSRQFK